MVTKAVVGCWVVDSVTFCRTADPLVLIRATEAVICCWVVETVVCS